jgi:hypothetical protein
MPEPSVWGPLLWRFLHAFADRVGKGATITRADESREALWLIEHLDTVIPCSFCRSHWRQYRRSIPGRPTADWMFAAHNSINQRVGKTVLSVIPPVTITPREAWGKYVDAVKDSLARGDLEGNRVSEFTHHVGLWVSFS